MFANALLTGYSVHSAVCKTRRWRAVVSSLHSQQIIALQIPLNVSAEKSRILSCDTVLSQMSGISGPCISVRCVPHQELVQSRAKARLDNQILYCGFWIFGEFVYPCAIDRLELKII